MSKCQGEIRRSYGTFGCPAKATYAIRNNDDLDDIRCACRHHLAQVIDTITARPSSSVLVVPVAK